MDTTFAKMFGGVEIEQALPVLMQSNLALDRLKEHLGPAQYLEFLKLYQDGVLEGDLSDQAYDFFSDEIVNEGKPVWSGELFNPEEPDDSDQRYPIRIYAYEGIFYVWATEYDPMGYFLTASDAENCMHSNWGDRIDSE